jgi:hypothetical protein
MDNSGRTKQNFLSKTITLALSTRKVSQIA